MDGPPFCEHAATNMNDLKARGFEHLLRGLLHVFGHAALVVAKFIVKAQRRDSPLVFHHWVEVNVVFVARQHLAESAHADEGALVLAHFFFKGGPEAMNVGSPREHGAAAAALESVAADEFGVLLGKVAKPRQVEAAGAAVVERGRLADEVFCSARYAGPHNVFAEIVADVPAGVCQPVWIEARFGEQEQASEFERGGGEE